MPAKSLDEKVAMLHLAKISVDCASCIPIGELYRREAGRPEYKADRLQAIDFRRLPPQLANGRAIARPFFWTLYSVSFCAPFFGGRIKSKSVAAAIPQPAPGQRHFLKSAPRARLHLANPTWVIGRDDELAIPLPVDQLLIDPGDGSREKSK